MKKSFSQLRHATASQYTMSIDIFQEQFEDFYELDYDQESQDKGFAKQFEEQFLGKLKKILAVEKEIIKHEEGLTDDDVKDLFQIELCRFQFENQKLLNYLQESASLLRSPKGQKKINELNSEMQEYKDGNQQIKKVNKQIE